MAEQTKESPVEYGTIRLPKEMVRKLGIVAQHTGDSIGEIVGSMIGDRVEKKYRDVVRAMNNELGEAGA